MERRSSARRGTRVELQARTGKRAFAARLHDIALSGCRLDCSELDLYEGDKIAFNFSDHIRVSGKIVWRRGVIAGVRFDAPLHEAIASHLGFKADGARAGGGEAGPARELLCELDRSVEQGAFEEPRRPITAAALRVVIVDDDEIMRKLLRRTLERMGFDEIYAAKDGAEGYELARSQQPDIILSDYEMPTKHGLQMLKTVREDPALDLTAFIMLSGVANDAVTDKARELGANSTIVKPFFADDLRRRLEAAVLEASGRHIEWTPRKPAVVARRNPGTRTAA